MKLDIFLSRFKNVEVENKLLKFAIVVIGVTVLINTGLLYQSLNSHRTVIVPPAVHSRFELYGNKATDEYYKEFARYISSLAFSYTPVTVRSQFTELLGMYVPSAYNEARNFFYDMAEKIETSQISSVFYLNGVTVSGEERIITVNGLLIQYAPNGSKMSENQKKYNIEFAMDNGRFGVVKIYEKEGQ
jgi:conjugal transfer pilus assembly protein TraE